MKKVSSLSVYANFIEVSRKQTALGAPSLVFSPSARTCSLKRSHHYALGHEHALKAKILRDHRAPWVESRRGATAVGRRESLLPAVFAIMPVPQSPP